MSGHMSRSLPPLLRLCPHHAPHALAAAGESDGWPNRTPSFRLGVGVMGKLPGDVWYATGHLDRVLLATLALGFGVQKWARVPT